MLLYVNAALRRTPGGYSYLGHQRGNSIKPSSLSAIVIIKLRCQQRSSSSTDPRLPAQSPGCHHLQRHLSSPKSRFGANKPQARHIHHCAALLKPPISDATTLDTNGSLGLEESETAESGVKFRSLDRLGAQSQEALQYVSSAPQQASNEASQSYCDGASDAPVTRYAAPFDTSLQNNHAVIGEQFMFDKLRAEHHEPRDRPSRRVSKDFENYLTQLKWLISQKRGTEHIKATFKYMIDVKDNLLQAHGSALQKWLDRPWYPAKATQVMELLLGGIVASSYQTLMILQSLNKVEDDFLVRSRCLSFIASIHKDSLLDDATQMSMWDAEVEKLWSRSRWPSRGLRRQDLVLMFSRMDHMEAQTRIPLLLENGRALGPGARVWLATYCAHNRMESQALSLLTSLPFKMLRSPGQQVLSCCQVLIGHDEVESTTDGANFKYLPRLLEHGLTPDNMLYTRIIKTALESGYSGVAWDVFHHLQASKVKPDPWTYFYLLRNAFDNSNVAGVQEIMSEIQRDETLHANLPLLHYSMNIVRRIFFYDQRITTVESLSHILALYDRVFSREPLMKLRILPYPGSSKYQTGGPRSGSEHELGEPDAYSLSLTIWAYVLCHRGGKHGQTLWRRIQELVEAGDTTIVACMRHDLIYNAFLWLNLREAGTMSSALEILQYMLAKQICVPTDRTWSILICGFLRHDQKAQAQQIYELMRKCKLSLRDIRREYWRKKWTFEYFEKHLEEILDERMMPDGTETGELRSRERSNSNLEAALLRINLEEEDDEDDDDKYA